MDDDEEGLLGRRDFGKAVGGTLLGAGALSRAGVDRVSAQEGGASGPTVYFGSDDRTLYAVDASSGEEEWAFTEPSGRVSSPPTIVDGTVYFGARDDTLYAVDASTGEQEWAFTEPSRDVYSSPTVVDGTVYFGAYDDTLYAVDAESGTQE